VSVATKKHAKVGYVFQAICVLLNVFAIVFVTRYRLFEFRIQEIEPQMNIVTPASYASFGGFSNVIKLGLYVNEFEKFDVVSGDFVFTGVIWFMFDPGTISFDTLENFNIEKGRIIERSPPDTQIIDEKVLVRYNVRVQFTSPLNYLDFPFDDHRLYIVIAHKFFSPAEVLFDSSEREFVVNADVTTLGWSRINREAKAGYVDVHVDEYDDRKTRSYPIGMFAIDYERFGSRFMLSILLPLFLLFYLSLFSFSLGIDDGVKLAMGSITVIVGYRFVIERLSPTVGYFMISDYIFSFILLLSCLVFFANIIDFLVVLTLNQKRFLVVFFHLIIDLLGGYVLFMV
jgi:hypothetical protein